MPPAALPTVSRTGIAALLATSQGRAEALDRAVAALDRSPIPVTGVVRLEVATTSGDVEAWTTVISPSSVSLAPASTPQATVRVGLDDLVALAAGDADGALLYLAGRIQVDGEEQLVLEVGRSLRPLGSSRAVIDPAALDPLAVSAAIGEASLAHLSAVMAGGFRDLVLSEVFRRMPEFLIAEKAANARVGIAFEIENDRTGDLDRYVVRVEAGECRVEADAPADAQVDATLVLAGHEFLRLALGHLNPVRGLMSGELRVRGHMIKALAFNSVIRIPGS